MLSYSTPAEFAITAQILKDFMKFLRWTWGNLDVIT